MLRMTERALTAREKLQDISEAVLGGEVGGDGGDARRDDGKSAISAREVVVISEAVLGGEVGGDGGAKGGI